MRAISKSIYHSATGRWLRGGIELFQPVENPGFSDGV